MSVWANSELRCGSLSWTDARTDTWTEPKWDARTLKRLFHIELRRRSIGMQTDVQSDGRSYANTDKLINPNHGDTLVWVST